MLDNSEFEGKNSDSTISSPSINYVQTHVSPSLTNRGMPSVASFYGIADSKDVKASPTTCTASASADSLNGIAGSPHMSPSLGNAASLVMPNGNNVIDSQIPFYTLSPKLTVAGLPPGIAASPAMTDIPSTGTGGKRFAAASSLSRLQKATPSTAAIARPPQHSFPTGHTLPNFQAGSSYTGSLPFAQQRSPGEQFRTPTDQNQRSPLLGGNEIVLDSNGQSLMVSPASRSRDLNYGAGTSLGSGPNNGYAGRSPATTAGTIGSEFDGYRSPQGSHPELPMQMVQMENETDGFTYKIQFKTSQKNFIKTVAVNDAFHIGDFVCVDADRGFDLGVIVEMQSVPVNINRDNNGMVSAPHLSGMGHILRRATPFEIENLPDKFANEQVIEQTCIELCENQYRLPIRIRECEYQFDRNKITIYYESNRRIDHRELVRDLYGLYKARIWMEPVTQPFRVFEWAKIQLATGMPQPYLQQQHQTMQQQQQQLMQQQFYSSPSQTYGQSPGPTYRGQPSQQQQQFQYQQQSSQQPQLQQQQQQFYNSTSSSNTSVHSSPASSSGYSSGLGPSPSQRYRSSPQVYQQQPYVIPPPRGSPRQQQMQLNANPSPISSRFLSPRQVNSTIPISAQMPSSYLLSPQMSNSIPAHPQGLGAPHQQHLAGGMTFHPSPLNPVNAVNPGLAPSPYSFADSNSLPASLTSPSPLASNLTASPASTTNMNIPSAAGAASSGWPSSTSNSSSSSSASPYSRI